MSQNQNGISIRFFKPKLKPLNSLPGLFRPPLPPSLHGSIYQIFYHFLVRVEFGGFVEVRLIAADLQIVVVDSGGFQLHRHLVLFEGRAIGTDLHSVPLEEGEVQ